MAHGCAAGEYRPRSETLHWAVAAELGLVALWAFTRDPGYLFPAAMCLALMLQCSQRIVVDGHSVQRFGLRPVVLDLTSAHVVRAGSAWWRELFFCGPVLELRDADGRRLYVESWLWDAATRATLVAAARPPIPV